MAYKSIREYGSYDDRSVYGDVLLASDGNGMTYDSELSVQGDQEFGIVTPEELLLLIEAGAKNDISHGTFTHPPQVEATLSLATQFYDTYLCDTTLDRVEVIDRYATELITQLEAARNTLYAPKEAEVTEYVRAVHEEAEQLLAA